MIEHIPSFGRKIDSIEYLPRPGAYGILFNERGLVAVIYINQRYFLPGGGREQGESILACLNRELLDELGCKVLNTEPIGRADEFSGPPVYQRHYLVSGHYFKITDFRLGREQTDKTHSVEWLEPEKALTGLYREAQRWAMAKALGIEFQAKEDRC